MAAPVPFPCQAAGAGGGGSTRHHRMVRVGAGRQFTDPQFPHPLPCHPRTAGGAASIAPYPPPAVRVLVNLQATCVTLPGRTDTGGACRP